MAHYAKVDDGIVTCVLVVPDEHEDEGEAYLNGLALDGRWIQTSYNTLGNVHKQGGVPLRKNYAGVGYSYDEKLDAFIAPRPYPSWILDEDSGIWEPPVPMPADGFFLWDESTAGWVSAIPGLPDYDLE